MEKIHKLLRSNSWSIKSDKERLDILKALEAQAARNEGRSERSVVAEDRPGLLGLYDTGKDRIVISNLAMDSAGLAMCTILHEGRHAFQHDVMTGKIKEPKSVVTWSKNWNGYLNPNNPGISQIDYYLQPIEKDAWSYSIKNLEVIANKAKDPYILNDLTDIKLTFNAQAIKAQRVYGKGYERVIQGKIDVAYSQKKSSYVNVVEELSKQGIREDIVAKDYIVPIAKVQSLVQEKADRWKIQGEAAEKKKAEERIKIAKKYGFDERVLKSTENQVKKDNLRQETSVAKELSLNKKNSKNKTQKNNNEKATTVKVTVQQKGK